jgi:hypothetical protein
MLSIVCCGRTHLVILGPDKNDNVWQAQGGAVAQAEDGEEIDWASGNQFFE